MHRRMLPADFQRHDLVWLSRTGWLAALKLARPEHVTALEQWRRHDWPAIVRRRDLDANTNEISLGIPLPPHPESGAKARIALRVLNSDVVKTTRAVGLDSSSLAALAIVWQPGLSALASDACGLHLRLYGSCAMQALTGQAYLTASSDIDLLFYPATEQQLRAGLAVLKFHARSLPLDGEIIFPDASAVAWKEWLIAEAGTSRVLVKQRARVLLAPLTDLLATFATPGSA